MEEREMGKEKDVHSSETFELSMKPNEYSLNSLKF